MIIQCEQCQTKFKLDDSKVADKGIKVRCARCRHVFSVAGTQVVPADSAALAPDVPEFRIEEYQEILPVAAAQETLVGPEHDTLPEEDTATEATPFDSFSFAADEEQTAPPAGDETAEPAGAGPALDFGDSTEKQGQAAFSPRDSGGVDFSGDDMFGDVVSTTPEAESTEPVSFDREMDDFADFMGVESGAAQQVATEELTSSQELLFAPVATPETKTGLDFTADTADKTAPAAAQEEPPPLSIASRRRESPRKSAMLVFMGIIIAGLAVFYSYWGYMTQTENKRVAIKEPGQITLRSVVASFITNDTVGDLLVISGEAVNTYDKPRAAIQIKGIVYGAKGEEVSSKSVFCGNPLSKEQLSTLTMDKIEAAMANQFGDSLSNMEVAPGAAIPFMIVMPKPPTGATDYGVEPVGSTVATGGKEK